jgi:hypothetical protein
MFAILHTGGLFLECAGELLEHDPSADAVDRVPQIAHYRMRMFCSEPMIPNV